LIRLDRLLSLFSFIFFASGGFAAMDVTMVFPQLEPADNVYTRLQTHGDVSRTGRDWSPVVVGVR
jgi:hypothetical protein